MTIFVALVLATLTFVFIAYPLFRQRSPSVNIAEDERLRELVSQRDTTYSMLKELEFDLQSGILSEADYQDLEARYKKKAISILKDIDGLAEGGQVEDAIERQVLGLRRRKSAGVEAGLEKEILELRQGKERFCHQCRAKYHEGDQFCSHCGTSLTQGEHHD